MGFWSSIEVTFEIEENWYDTKHVEYPPSVWDLNRIFKDYDFFDMPFGSEGIPDVRINSENFDKVTITVLCKDENVSEIKVIEWWYQHIWTTHATKARLIIKPDWTNYKIDLKYKNKVKTHEEVVEEEECISSSLSA